MCCVKALAEQNAVRIPIDFYINIVFVQNGVQVCNLPEPFS